MSLPNSLEAVSPALSVQPVNFSQKDPGVGGWKSLFNQAEAADAVGIDRLCVSDHVVLGESLEDYADPKTVASRAVSNRPIRRGIGSIRSFCSRCSPREPEKHA